MCIYGGFGGWRGGGWGERRQETLWGEIMMAAQRCVGTEIVGAEVGGDALWGRFGGAGWWRRVLFL